MRPTAAQRNKGYLRELDTYFHTVLVDDYASRAADRWDRDYSGTEQYTHSVSGMRDAWRDVLAPPALERSGDPAVTEGGVDGRQTWWVQQPLEDGLSAQGRLGVPDGEPAGLVIFQHGLGSSPDRAFGVGDPEKTYDEVALRLLDAGYAVLAPLNLSFVPERNRGQRLARLAGTTMEGIELARLGLLLDSVQEHFELDTSRIGFWGSSWGGMAAQFFTPLEDRIAVAITSGFFNNRQNKMVVDDPRYGSFEARNEEHAYLFGHLTAFGDADLASLICPRAFMVQHGKLDGIGWWPQVLAEYEAARSHWQELGIADRATIDLHDAGHVVNASPGVDWIRTWL